MASNHVPSLKEVDIMREQEDRNRAWFMSQRYENDVDSLGSTMGSEFGDILHTEQELDWDYYELGGNFGSTAPVAEVQAAAGESQILSKFDFGKYSSALSMGASQIRKMTQYNDFGPRASAYAVAETSKINSIAGQAMADTQEPWQQTNVNRWQASALNQLGELEAQNSEKLIKYNQDINLFNGVLDLGYAVAPLLGPEAELAYAGVDIAASTMFSPSQPSLSTLDLHNVADNSVKTHGSFFAVETPQDIVASNEISNE